MHLNTRTDVFFCTRRWWKSGWSLLSMELRTQFYFLPKTSWDDKPSEMRSGPENSLASPHRNDVKLSPCITEIQVAFLDAMSDCVKWKWFSKWLLSPEHMWLFESSMMVSCAMPSEGSKVTHIQQRSTEIDCLTLHRLRFLWIAWILWQNYVWKMMKGINALQSWIEKCDSFFMFIYLFIFFDNSLKIFGTKWWAMTHLCLKRLRSTFIPKQTWCPQLNSYYQFTCSLWTILKIVG